MRVFAICLAAYSPRFSPYVAAYPPGWALGLMLVLLTAHTPAAQVTLAWNTPTTNTDGTPLTTLAGYRLYSWHGTLGMAQSVDVGNQTTYTLTGLVEGVTYTFAVTAYNTLGIEQYLRYRAIPSPNRQ